MINYLKDKNQKSGKNYEIYKTLTSKLKSVGTVVIIGGTTRSAILSVTGVGLILVSICAGFACALSLGNKKTHKLVFNKKNY